jgi:hypothetical protein
VLSKIGNVLSIVAIATSWIPGVNAVTATAAAVVSGAPPERNSSPRQQAPMCRW